MNKHLLVICALLVLSSAFSMQEKLGRNKKSSGGIPMNFLQDGDSMPEGDIQGIMAKCPPG